MGQIGEVFRMTRKEWWGMLFLTIIVCAVLLCSYLYGSPWM
jgi:hypothetical protein